VKDKGTSTATSVPVPTSPTPGRPRKYGDKVKLYEVFDHLHLFDLSFVQY
jgi:hypothetical protein